MASRLLFASDVRVVRTPHGDVLATHPVGELASFTPFRDAWGPVTVISRDATNSPSHPEVGGPLTGEGVRHLGVPDYSSWLSLLRAMPATTVAVWRAVGRHDLVWVRLPEPLSVLVGLVARMRRRHLVVNLVADPESLALPGRESLVRPLLAGLVKALIRGASGVVYVTRAELQRRFPVPDCVPTLARSNVMLDSVAERPRTAPPRGRARLLTVGTNSRLSKGQDTVLDAVKLLVDRGVDASAVFIGGGDRTEWLRHRATELEISTRCEVRGHVSEPARVHEAYRDADVFVLPSRSEGLPRAMIEALAAGLPTVGSAVGGIPELLPSAQVVRSPDGHSLAQAVLALLADPERYRRASAEALDTAEEIRRSTRPCVLREFLATVVETSGT